MSTVEKSYALHILADIRKYQEEFAKVPGYTDKQAAKAAENLVKRMTKASEDASRAARGAASKATEAFKRLGDTAGDLGGGAKKLRGLLGSIAPEAATAAGAVDDVGDGFEVLAAMGTSLLGPLGAIVVAVGAGAAAYKLLSVELDRAQAKQERQREIVTALGPLYQDLRKAKRELAVATGDLTAADAKQLDIQDQWNAKLGETISKLEEQRKLLRDQIEPGILDTAAAYFGVKDAIDEVAHSQADSLGWLAVGAKLWDNDVQKKKGLANELTRVDIAQQNATKAAKAGAAAQTAAAGATGDHTDKAAAQKQTLDDLAEAQRRYTATMAEFASISKAANESQLTGQAKLLAAQGDQLAKIREIEAAQLAEAKTEMEAAAIRIAAAETSKDVILASIAEQGEAQREAREKASADADRIRAEQDAKDVAANERATQAAQEVADAKLSIATQSLQLIQDASEFVAENMTKGQKKAAMAFFIVMKLAAVAQAAVNTALAISTALASAPPPYNIALAAVAGTAGGLAAAKVAAAPPPQFHAGTASGVRGPRDVPIMAEEGEIIVRRDQARRPEVRAAVGRANAQMPYAQQPIIADRYNGRLWFASLRDAARAGLTTTDINRRKRFGHFVPTGG